MRTKHLIGIIILFVMVVVIWIGFDTFTQPGVSDLDGQYMEVSHYRNENNTGPVVRIYAVYTSDSLWADMEAYGNFMPHTKYGNTKVFFFKNLEQTPENVEPEPPYFDPKYQAFCIGKYEKTAMGQISMLKYPFGQVE